MANNINGDLVKYTIKELLLEIREQIMALDKRLDTLEKDMQEGKETVKTMLLPDYHGFKASMQVFERETQVHLDKLDRQAEKEAGFHTDNVPVFRELIRRVEAVEKNTVTQEAISKYRKWLLLTAIPATLGAIWALIRIVEVVSNGRITP